MRKLEQEIRALCRDLSDSELLDRLSSVRFDRRNIWDSCDPEQFDTPFYQYMVGDMDATIDIYELLARERGLDV